MLADCSETVCFRIQSCRDANADTPFPHLLSSLLALYVHQTTSALTVLRGGALIAYLHAG